MQLLERYRPSLFVPSFLILVMAAVAIQPSTNRRCTRSQGHVSATEHPVMIAGMNHRDLADQHYRAKRFDDAAATLRDAAASGDYDPRTAGELLMIAAFYKQLEATLDLGSDPTIPPHRAFEALRWALQLDEMLGGTLADDIRTPLGTVAQRAAWSYAAKGNDEGALEAVELAESLRGPSASTKLVRKVLAERAAR